MRDLLGSFGLQGEIVEQEVKYLSGGERSRAALARLTVEGANVLVLDEPTNHLDFWACDSLEEALKKFDGTVLVVSHDRYFLNRVVDMLIVIEPGHAEVVYGNYELYVSLSASRALEMKAEAIIEQQNREEKRTDTARGAVRRKRKYPYRKAEEIEADIHATEARITELEIALQDVELYKDPVAVKQTMSDLETLNASLPKLYEHWEEANELNG